MYIEQLCSKTGMQDITVHFNYDEIRDLANAMYHVTSGEKPDKDYSELAAKCHVLFDLVKHGMVQPGTVKKLSICQCKNKESGT